ncbi:site-specific DNA-methyltransferase [Acetobacterium sp.]|uniref:site-specific DNA-methyltransferase n=1 Tax=Acetobacterium sp. TaxID=1872094 RepID=UPI002F414870
MIETILTGETPDLAQENIEKLKNLFPDIVTDGKIDLDKLKQDLGDYVDDSTERYNFSWNGKGQALRLAQTPSTGTLRPCKEESKDWDTTQNLYIEGDNLEVLKLLQKSYHSKVKMIYIDPPYNTGKDFVYPDNFKDSIENYKAITGQTDSEGKNISSNTETSGRYHTDWLNMMYPRLRLARNLLTDDGVIFISIDDNEVDNLKKICNEIFGEDNFVACVVWQKKYAATNDSKGFSTTHDYIVSFQKSNEFHRNLLPRTNEQNKPYKNDDGDGKGLWRTGDLLVKSFSQSGVYPILNPKTNKEYLPPKGSCWRASKDTMKKWLEENRIYFGKEGTGAPQIKRYLNEVQQGRVPITWWGFAEVGHNDAANKELSLLFESKTPFDTPKPVSLISRILQISTNINSNDIIIDFFSGSATTAHAVMKLNAEDQGNRKFIMVQLPEPTDKNSEAAKAGYDNICEIGKERIRRAGEKIKEEKGLLAQNLDIGFKVLKLDTSNIRKWQPYGNDLEVSLLDAINNYVDDRTELDVVYEIMLKFGLDLTYSVEEFIIEGKKVYSIGFGVLLICLDNDITTGIAKGILEKVQKLASETTRVVFKDNGFKTDSNKTNIKEILKCGGIDEFITL